MVIKLQILRLGNILKKVSEKVSEKVLKIVSTVISILIAIDVHHAQQRLMSWFAQPVWVLWFFELHFNG